MDEISQDPKLDVRFPRGRFLDVAVAVALIAAAAITVLAGRAAGLPPLPRAGPARRRPRRCCHRPCGHGSRCRSASPAA